MKKNMFKLPKNAKKGWTDFQKKLFIDFCDNIRGMRNCLTKSELNIQDEEWEVIIHNVCFLQIEYLKYISNIVYLPENMPEPINKKKCSEKENKLLGYICSPSL